MSITVVIPPNLAAILRSEAERRGVPIEDVVLEKLLSDVDPEERAKEYMSVALTFLKDARNALSRGDLRQASEKIWGAVALAIKAHAYKVERRRLASHGELWEYKDKLVKTYGEWVRDCWHAATHMHINFYEGWATRTDIEDALRKAERLVGIIKKEVLEEN